MESFSGDKISESESVSAGVCVTPSMASSLGFFRIASSVGVGGGIGCGIMGNPAMVMPCSWLATTFLGLSGSGLAVGGVETVWRLVFNSGTGSAFSRLRFGEGWKAESWVGGIAQ